MSTRIKDSERQKMLVNYVKEGIIPDGFYVKVMKDGRIQFRRIKQPGSREVLLHKIELYKLKLKEAEQALQELDAKSSSDGLYKPLRDFVSSDSVSNDSDQ